MALVRDTSTGDPSGRTLSSLTFVVFAWSDHHDFIGGGLTTAIARTAAITGRPSALAAALLKVSDSLVQVPVKELRAAAKLNAFNLVAIEPQRRWWPRIRLLSRLTATYPPLQNRLDALGEHFGSV